MVMNGPGDRLIGFVILREYHSAGIVHAKRISYPWYLALGFRLVRGISGRMRRNQQVFRLSTENLLSGFERLYLSRSEIKHPLLLPPPLEEEFAVPPALVVETVMAPGSSMVPFAVPSESVSGSPSVKVKVIRLSPSLLPKGISTQSPDASTL
jgi:hypothetical protein